MSAGPDAPDFDAHPVPTAERADAGVAPPRRTSGTPALSRLGLGALDPPPPYRRSRPGPPGRSLIGRALELQTIRDRLADGARLIVLVGMGGIGKSALTAAVADEVRAVGRPVFRCGFDTAASVDLLPDRLAAVMGIDMRSPLREQRVARLGRALDRLPAPLVVLDGFETLGVEGARVIERWLEMAPELRVLLSSRTWISLSAAARITVGPLSCVGSDRPSPAARLFWQRAARARAIERTDAAEEIVESIVSRLDGIPLAIELAAARVAVFDLPTLGRRIERGAAVLSDPTGSTPERHRTLTRTIEWSWRLLTPAARDGLAQLAIFRGAFGLDDAEAVLAVDGLEPADVLQQLFAASLLVRAAEAAGEPMAWRLLAPVRDAVIARGAIDLDAGPTPERYARWLLDESGPDDLATLYAAGDAWLHALRRRRAEYVALATCAPSPVVRLRATLRRIADPQLRGARQRVLSLLDRALADLPDTPAHRLLIFTAQIARALAGVHGAMPSAVEDAVERIERVADGLDGLAARALVAYVHGLRASVAARFEEARTTLAEAWGLARQTDDAALLAFVGQNRIAIARDAETGRAIGRETMAFARRASATVRFAQAASAMALILAEPDEQDRRVELLEGALAVDRRLQPTGVRSTLVHRLASVRHAQGAFDEAERLYGRAVEWGTADQAPVIRSSALGGLGLLALDRQDPHRALAAFEAAVACGAGGFAQVCRWCVALLHIEQGQADGLSAIPTGLPDTRGEPFYDVRSPLEAWTRVVRHRADPQCTPLAAMPPELTAGPVAPTVVVLRRLGRLAWMRSSPPADGLVFDGRRMRLPGRPWRSTGRSRVARDLLDALLDTRLRSPGHPCTADRLISAVWPEEKTPGSEAARNRLHVGLHKVRALGLRPWLRRHADGWSLDPALTIVRVDRFGSTRPAS